MMLLDRLVESQIMLSNSTTLYLREWPAQDLRSHSADAPGLHH